MIALMELGESFWALWHRKRMQSCCNDVSMKWTIDGIIWNPRVLQSGLYKLHMILVCDIFEVFGNYHAHLDYIIRNSWWTLVFTTWNSEMLMHCASVVKMFTKPYLNSVGKICLLRLLSKWWAYLEFFIHIQRSKYENHDNSAINSKKFSTNCWRIVLFPFFSLKCRNFKKFSQNWCDINSNVIYVESYWTNYTRKRFK